MAPRPLHSAGLCWLRQERDPVAVAVSESDAGAGLGGCADPDPGGRVVSKGGGTWRGSGSARCAALSTRVRPPSTAQRPPPGARVLGLEGALLAPVRSALPGDVRNIWWGFRAHPKQRRGSEEGLRISR